MDRTVIPLTITAEKDEHCNLRVLVSSAAVPVPCGCVRCPDGRAVCGCPPRCPEQEFVRDGEPLAMDVHLILEGERVVDIEIHAVGQSQSS